MEPTSKSVRLLSQREGERISPRVPLKRACNTVVVRGAGFARGIDPPSRWYRQFASSPRRTFLGESCLRTGRGREREGEGKKKQTRRARDGGPARTRRDAARRVAGSNRRGARSQIRRSRTPRGGSPRTYLPPRYVHTLYPWREYESRQFRASSRFGVVRSFSFFFFL